MQRHEHRQVPAVSTLNLSQAAALLMISEDALMRKARAGIVPASKPGRRWVFRREALDEYLAKLEQERVCHSTAILRARTGGSAP
jgi:excisionase family DNA binding protein